MTFGLSGFDPASRQHCPELAGRHHPRSRPRADSGAPDAGVGVVICNCVINLSTVKLAVLAEMFRVLVPAGRIGISDVAAEDHLPAADRATASQPVRVTLRQVAKAG